MQQTPPFPTAMFGAMGLLMFVYILLMLGVTLAFLIALWRAMRAHEAIARQLENIAQALGQRRDG